MARAHAASFMSAILAHMFDHGCSHNNEPSRTLYILVGEYMLRGVDPLAASAYVSSGAAC